MSGKFNNRILLIIFAVLAAIFVVTRFTTFKRSNQTLKSDLVRIDTSRVTTMKLYPKADQGSELVFRKEESGWTVAREGLVVPASSQSVQSALTEIQRLEAEQLVARSAEKWEQYHVNDSLGTRIILQDGKKTWMDLVVGRFHYQPAQGGNSMYGYGQNQGTAFSYVRLSGEEEVYSVEGFLAMSLNQPFTRWRDQTLTRLNTGQLQRIIYEYPSDSGFVAEKSEAGWMVAGILADSATMSGYINQLARKSYSTYADDFEAPSEPDYRITFEGENMNSQQVKGYLENDSMMVVGSTINPGTHFRLAREDAAGDLFKGAGRLTEGSE